MAPPHSPDLRGAYPPASYRLSNRAPDGEVAAFAILARRVAILRRCVAVACILAALPLALAGYLTIEQMQLTRFHMASIQMSAVVGVVPPVVILCYAIGPVSRVLVAIALRSWIPSLAATSGVHPETLRDLSDAWE